MADIAIATESNEARRTQMLQAAADVIRTRGFGDTRIADVAKLAGTSSALVLYYFGSRERLLVDALRFSEECFYDAAEQMLTEIRPVRERLDRLIRWTCVPQHGDNTPMAWGLWFDLWAQAFRHEELGSGRIELDARWRDLITTVVQSGQHDGDVPGIDARRFACTFAALLDGLSIQVALNDPEVDAESAYEIAMDFAVRELSLPARV